MAKQVLLSTDAGGRRREAVMLNVGIVTYSLCTPTGHRSSPVGSHDALVRGARHVYSLDDVAVRCSNFAAWSEAFGGVSPGKIQIDSQQMKDALGRLTDRTDELLAIEDVREHCDIRTPLFEAARGDRGGYGPLSTGDALSPEGHRLLDDVHQAQSHYSRLPELLGFGTENPSRGENPVMRAAKVAKFMRDNAQNPLRSRWQLNWVAYELKPLNIRDLKWHGNDDGGARTESIDHLLEFQQAPVLAEVKTERDCGGTATSKALWQVLYYGSTMANGTQARRLVKMFPQVAWLAAHRPWLALIVEHRAAGGFVADWNQVLAFARNPEVGRTLSPYFSGLFQIKVRGNAEGTVWQVANGNEHCVQWCGGV